METYQQMILRLFADGEIDAEQYMRWKEDAELWGAR